MGVPGFCTCSYCKILYVTTLLVKIFMCCCDLNFTAQLANIAHQNIEDNLHVLMSSLTSKVKEVECVAVPLGNIFIAVHVYTASSSNVTELTISVLLMRRVEVTALLVLILIRSEVSSSTPSLYHDKEGSGLPDALHSIETELPTVADISPGVPLVVIAGSKNNTCIAIYRMHYAGTYLLIYHQWLH